MKDSKKQNLISIAYGSLLREHRKKSGLSQEKLALLSGVDRSFISEIERGVKSPTLKTMLFLAEHLNVAAYQLVMKVEEKLSHEDRARMNNASL